MSQNKLLVGTCADRQRLTPALEFKEAFSLFDKGT